MRLTEMELVNFRQFYGEQTIEFASGDRDRNVTVFHGFNGSGKTALLNAFVWCLYGETTPDLEAADRLENERAVAQASPGDKVRVSVSLRFTLHGGAYRVVRERVSKKSTGNALEATADSLSLWRIPDSGQLESVGKSDAARQKHLEEILPRTLHPFFFFNGERVEQLASPDAFDRVEMGVKTLLDIEVYERGARHLVGPVGTILTGQLRGLGDSELDSVANELQELQATSEELEEERKLRAGNIAHITSEIEQVERRQSEIRDIQELVTKRKGLRERESQLNTNVVDGKKALASVLSRHGYLAFGEPVLARTEALVTEARTRGEIPAKIKPQFVDDILDRGVCICGRDIQPSSNEEKELREWRDATGLAEFEERISYTSAFVPRLRERRAEFFSVVDTTNERLQQFYTERRQVREDLALVEEQLGDPGLEEDAASLQERIKTLRRDREQETAHRLIAERDLAENQAAIEDARRRLKRLEVQDEKALLVRKQLEAVERVAEAFADIARIQKDDVRASLDEKIKEVWNDAAIKDYEASVTEDYRLLLTKKVEGQRQPVHGASTGEKQVLALSFVGSLVHKARENAGKVHGIDVGGHYPLVMDSPFGSLEDAYRAKVATWIPTLADQVVVMASRTQWRDEVESAMRPRIGREYILELHTPKAGVDREIDIGGRSHAYVVSSADPTEQTIIRRI